jgi:hypothetical protein
MPSVVAGFGSVPNQQAFGNIDIEVTSNGWPINKIGEYQRLLWIAAARRTAVSLDFIVAFRHLKRDDFSSNRHPRFLPEHDPAFAGTRPYPTCLRPPAPHAKR